MKEGEETLSEDKIKHPNHYTSGDVECIDALRSALGDDGFEGYCAGNIVKYVWRYKHKSGVDDLRKARQYLDWLIDEKALDERAAAEQLEELLSLDKSCQAQKDNTKVRRFIFGSEEVENEYQ